MFSYANDSRFTASYRDIHRMCWILVWESSLVGSMHVCAKFQGDFHKLVQHGWPTHVYVYTTDTLTPGNFTVKIFKAGYIYQQKFKW